MHPDHVGGLKGADVMAGFGDATLHVNAPELAFWRHEAIASGAPAEMQPFVSLAYGVARPAG